MKKLYSFFVIILIGIIINPIISNAQNSFKESAGDVGLIHRTEDDQIFAGGVVVFDYNNDGLDDVFFTGGILQDHLYKNLGNGHFKDVTVEAGLVKASGIKTSGATSGDIDNDGDRDLFVCTRGFVPNILYLNDGKGHFTNISEKAGITHKSWSTSVTMGDFNNDSYLDIYICNYASQLHVACFPNFFYINNGDNTFREVGLDYGVNDDGCSLAATFSDYDNDGDVDLLLANDFGDEQNRPNRLWKNDYPANQFIDYSDVSKMKIKMYGMALVTNDFNEDGKLDYFISNFGVNVFAKNIGNNTYENIIAPPMDVKTCHNDANGVSPYNKSSWGGAWIDYDNDSNIDYFESNGFVEDESIIPDPSFLYRNNGNGTFTDVTKYEGIFDSSRARGCAIIDFDNNGFPDIVANVVCLSCTDLNPQEHATFYKNQTVNNNNWLKVKLKGTNINRDAFGSKVMLHCGTRIFTKEVDGGGSTYQSQNSSTLMFGLGSIPKVDSIVVHWIGGTSKVLKDITPNQTMNIIQDLKRTVPVSVCKNQTFLGEVIVENKVKEVKIPQSGGYDSVITYVITAQDPKLYVRDTSFCKSKLFEGKLFAKDTSYSLKLIAKNGCDSVVNTTIHVFPEFTTNLNDSICYASLYNGKQYFNDQVITKTLTSQSGCDSIIKINLKILATPKFETDTTLCWGSYYNGLQYFENDAITKKFPSSLGCDSIFAIKIKVLPRIFITLKDTVKIPIGNSYKNTKYEKAGNYSILDTFVAKSGCDSTLKTLIYVYDPTDVEDNLAGNELNLTANPNPSVSRTNVSFELKNDDFVNISVYDLLGNNLCVIKNEKMSSGFHNFEWFNIDKNSNILPNGNYLIRLKTSNLSKEVKLIIQK